MQFIWCNYITITNWWNNKNSVWLVMCVCTCRYQNIVLYIASYVAKLCSTDEIIMIWNGVTMNDVANTAVLYS